MRRNYKKYLAVCSTCNRFVMSNSEEVYKWISTHHCGPITLGPVRGYIEQSAIIQCFRNGGSSSAAIARGHREGVWTTEGAREVAKILYLHGVAEWIAEEKARDLIRRGKGYPPEVTAEKIRELQKAAEHVQPVKPGELLEDPVVISTVQRG